MVKELPLLDIQAIRIDGIFMSAEEIARAIGWYSDVLNGKEVVLDDYAYTSGYLYQKTNIVK